MLSSLRHRPFAFLWAGQSISRLGDSLYRIALAWWVLQKTGSAAVMGTVLIFSMAPMMIFVLIGGVAADRFPRVRVMLLADILRLVVSGLVAALAAADKLEVWHIFIASMIFGTVGAFFQPAYVAIIPEITSLDIRNSANSLTSLSYKLSGVIGPAIGALIVKASGPAAAFALDSASFLVSAACIAPLLGHADTRVDAGPRQGILAEIKDGLATVAGIPWLWITITLFGFANVTLSGPMAVAMPFLVKDFLHADVDTLGAIYTVQSIGQILGAVLVGRMRKLGHRGLIGYGSQVIYGALLAVMGLGIPVLAVMAVNFVFGVFFSFFDLIWTATLQEMVPREKLGRVSSVDQLGSFVLLPIGYGVAGWATDILSAPVVFVVGGIGTALLTALAMLHPAIRKVD